MAGAAVGVAGEVALAVGAAKFMNKGIFLLDVGIFCQLHLSCGKLELACKKLIINQLNLNSLR